MSVPEGDLLCIQGGSCDGVFIILSGLGSVRVSNSSEDDDDDDAAVWSMRAAFGSSDLDPVPAPAPSAQRPDVVNWVVGGTRMSEETIPEESSPTTDAAHQGGGACGAHQGGGALLHHPLASPQGSLHDVQQLASHQGTLLPLDNLYSESIAGPGAYTNAGFVDSGSDLKTMVYGDGLNDVQHYSNLTSPSSSKESWQELHQAEHSFSAAERCRCRVNKWAIRLAQTSFSHGGVSSEQAGFPPHADATFGKESHEVHPGDTLVSVQIRTHARTHTHTHACKGISTNATS